MAADGAGKAHGEGADTVAHEPVQNKLERGESAASESAQQTSSRPFILFYDGSCGLCRKAVKQIEARRPRRPLVYIDVTDDAEMRKWPEIDRDLALDKVILMEPGGFRHHGYHAVTATMQLLPGLSALHPLLRLWPVQALGKVGYFVVGHNRHRISRVLGWE
jgi:predicted DCC family thiol-disulfide oxidoreductase YuxK